MTKEEMKLLDEWLSSPSSSNTKTPPSVAKFIDLDHFKGEKIERIEVRYNDKKYEINIIKFLETFGRRIDE